MKHVIRTVILVAVIVASASCSRRELNTKVSNVTGWNYYDKNSTNFQAVDEAHTGTPFGMVPIEGGTFTIGEKDEFITAPRNNPSRSLTVSSFYMDKYEITNLNWREYEHWMQMVFGNVAPELVNAVKPDTSVWRADELAYNEVYYNYYYRHPDFSYYPVVGVSWNQAMAYCQWRTDRVNELLLVQAGALEMPDFQEIHRLYAYVEDGQEDEEGQAIENDWYALDDNLGLDVKLRRNYKMKVINIPFSQADALGIAPDLEENDETPDSVPAMVVPYEYIRDHFVFNTEKYLYVKTYNPVMGRKPLMDSYGDVRKVTKNDGILVVGYRLPTEAEWEFAAYAPIADEDGLTIEGKIYPWSGYHPRDLSKKNLGRMQANFVRGKGDMMGTSGSLNDNYVITAPVDAFLPNDYGLYNMAGNVNEWVMDVYRETSYDEVTEYNSFRGNIYSKPRRDAMGNFILDSLGCIAIYYNDSADDRRDFKDGDMTARLETDFPLFPEILTANQKDSIYHLTWAQYCVVNEEDGFTQAEVDSIYREYNIDPLQAANITLPRTMLDSIYNDLYETKKIDLGFREDPTDVLAPRPNKTARVYKGGSWHDRIYWLSPSSRRVLDQDKASYTIGFRCAMSILGEQKIGK